jgi:peptide/nickel transport system permease protein
MKSWPVYVLALWLCAVVVAAAFDLAPDAIRLEAILHGPGPAAWLGNDDLGRNILSRILAGAAFPGILLAIAFAAVLGPGLNNLILALCLTSWVGYARLTRAQALSLRGRQHVQAAESLGAGTPRIMLRHMLPLLAAPLVVEATYSIAGLVIAEASLSFLGLGIQAPQASWGSMLRDGVRYMLVAPHYVLAVGLSLMSLVLAVNVLGDKLRDALDVKR